MIISKESDRMKFLSIISSVYVSSSVPVAYFDPDSLAPFFFLTVWYVSIVGAYEFWDRFERRVAK
jgi:hypothetical protein